MKTHKAFRKAGITADTVDGSTSIKERRRMYDALGEGELMVLTSCNVISIGFDEPSVEVGLMLRPTQSSALHFQQLGRVMRISPQTGKDVGIILDQAGNLQRLGFPEDIREYTLPTRKESKGGGGAAPLKPCPVCGRVIYAFIVRCPGCGHQWVKDRPLNLEDMVVLAYALIAGGLGGIFLLSTIQVLRNDDLKYAKLMFGYSVFYLFALFTAIMLV